jgi:hypothetical protein
MILAPTLSLSAGSGAAIARPTFSRDFAGEKTLNNGTGPAITFTRASNATFFDANGTLQTAANDTPRFDHSGGSSLGLLIEEARTNSIRNSQAGGAVAGAPGTMPTNWDSSAPTGISREVVATGTTNGLAYIDVKISGTSTQVAGGNGAIRFDINTQVAALQNQTWTASCYVAIIAGSTANLTNLWLATVERNSGGTLLQRTTTTISGSTLTRYVATRTLSDATAAFVNTQIELMGIDNGDVIDITLRIAAPQLEQGAFATSYIPTTTAAATRAADSAVVTPISSFYNQAEGTLFAEGSSGNTNNSLNALLSIDDTTANERIQIRRGTQFNLLNIVTATGGSPQASLDTSIGTWASPTEFKKIAYALKQNDLAVSMGGAAALTDTSATLPTVTRMVVGFGPNSQYANGHIRRIAYYPRRLSNTLLQQLTT